MDSEAVSALAAALERLSVNKVPPPAVCNNVEKISTFFSSFEKHVSSVYGDDKEAWLQVLPSFIGGPVLRIVQSFGADVNYEDMKERILSEFEVETAVTCDTFSKILEAKRKVDESLPCFLIRLEGLVRSIQLDIAGREALLLGALRKNVPSNVLHQIDLQVFNKPKTAGEFVKMAEAIYRAMCRNKPESNNVLVSNVDNASCNIATVDSEPSKDSPVSCTRCGRGGHTAASCYSRVSASDKVCYKCNERGHFARNCPRDAERTKPICFKCRTPGHISRNCPNVSGGLICGYCGASGHPMMKCPEFEKFQQTLSQMAALGQVKQTLNNGSLN